MRVRAAKERLKVNVPVLAATEWESPLSTVGTSGLWSGSNRCWDARPVDWED